MTIEQFPPHEMADETGLLALGGDLETDSLLLAYRNGIFPWPLNASTLAWFSPPARALIFTDKFHVSRSLLKESRNIGWTFSFNKNFPAVIKACAVSKHRPGQRGTWITNDIIAAYTELFKLGYVYSVETYFEGELVGGMYGVCIGSMFSGESMFFTKPNASKLALLYLIDYLKSRNIKWFDAQVMNANLARFNAEEVDREVFLKMLKPMITANKVPLGSPAER